MAILSLSACATESVDCSMAVTADSTEGDPGDEDEAEWYDGPPLALLMGEKYASGT